MSSYIPPRSPATRTISLDPSSETRHSTPSPPLVGHELSNTSNPVSTAEPQGHISESPEHRTIVTAHVSGKNINEHLGVAFHGLAEGLGANDEQSPTSAGEDTFEPMPAPSIMIRPPSDDDLSGSKAYQEYEVAPLEPFIPPPPQSRRPDSEVQPKGKKRSKKERTRFEPSVAPASAYPTLPYEPAKEAPPFIPPSTIDATPPMRPRVTPPRSRTQFQPMAVSGWDTPMTTADPSGDGTNGATEELPEKPERDATPPGSASPVYAPKFRASRTPRHLSSRRPQSLKFGTLDNYWDRYDEATVQYTDELLTGLKDNLDNLLIFAALFSAVNTAFLALSLPALSNDPAAETNTLLRLIVQGAQNSTLTPTDLEPPPYSPSPSEVRINQMFSISLTFSLIASFGALLGQQWLIYYKRRASSTPDGLRWESTRKLHGGERWRLRGALEILLPTLLQVALFVFMIGFIEFLYSSSHAVALPNLVLAVIGAFAFLTSIVISVWDPFCPFKTSLPILIARTIKGLEDWANRHARHWNQPLNRPRLEWRYSIVRFIQSFMAKLHRTPKDETLLGAARIRRVLETSTNPEVLLANAVNIPLIEDPAAIKVIWKNRLTLDRVSSLATTPSPEIPSSPAIYSIVFCHLALEKLGSGHLGPLGQSLTLDRILPIFKQAAQAVVNFPMDPLSDLPSAIATVAIVSGFNKPRMVRHDDFLFNSISRTPSPSYALGMIAWVISSEYTPRKATESGSVDMAYSRFHANARTADDGMGSITSAAVIYRKLRQAITDVDREHVALREVCSAFTRYDGSRGLHRIVLELLHGVSDYFKSSRLSYVEGRSRYSYILPAIDHMLRDNAAWRWDEVVDAAMELLLQFFNYLPDSTYQISDTPGMHPAERFCTSEENVVALTHYAQALARRHSKRSPQQAGYCFRLITTKVASDGLPSLPIQQEIKDTFMAACSRVPDDVWYQPEPATDDDDDASIVLPTNLSGGAMSTEVPAQPGPIQGKESEPNSSKSWLGTQAQYMGSPLPYRAGISY